MEFSLQACFCIEMRLCWIFKCYIGMNGNLIQSLPGDLWGLYRKRGSLIGESFVSVACSLSPDLLRVMLIAGDK